MEYGCIAEHLSHSFSKEIHARLADYSYALQELAPDEVGAFLLQRDFRGINVTIPYKQTVIPYLDEVSPIAQSIGAVNTIVNRDGRLIGYNTDFWGMKYLLMVEKINLKNKKVLIFGTGGTSKTARAVATHLGAREIVTVSRTASATTLTYDEAKARHADAEIMINTTPAGMYPCEEERPYRADPTDFPHLEGLLDAIYHPLRSELVLAARAKGIPAVGGLTMLVVQAAVAVEKFLGTSLPAEKVEAVDREIRMSKENIVLIGMPGSGKSTVGAALAKRYQRKLLDTDTIVQEMTGKSAARWIEEAGEAAFREKEAEAVSRAAAESGVIIATGGGAVLREENIRRLRRNGRLFFLDRAPEALPVTKDRPLSRDRERLLQRYAERIDKYRAAADSILPVTAGVKQMAQRVGTCFEAWMEKRG